MNNKFWVALVVALFAFLRVFTGFDLGVDDETATAIIGAVGAALVWLVPNRKGFWLSVLTLWRK